MPEQQRKFCAFINNAIPVPGPGNIQSGGIPQIVARTFFGECIKEDCKFWQEKEKECRWVLALERLIGEKEH